MTEALEKIFVGWFAYTAAIPPTAGSVEATKGTGTDGC